VSLVLRRQDSPHIPEWDRDKFWMVWHEGVSVGVIVSTNGRSDEPARWEWVIHLHAGRRLTGFSAMTAVAGMEATRAEAMAGFRQAFDKALFYIGPDGWAAHVVHMARSDAQAERWRRQREGTEPGGYG